VLVSPVDDNGTLRVYGVSDRRADLPACLTLRLVDLDGGGDRWRFDRDVTLKALASEPLFSASKGDLLKGLDPSHVVLSAELTAGGQTLTRNLFYFKKTRELALPQLELAVTVTPHRIGATVRVTARRFARAVWLSTPEGEGAFSDNFFDLLPGEAATVEWTPGSAARPGAAERLSTVLRATTVRDTY